MNKNRIEGVASQGERANNRKALVIKAGGVDPAVVRERSAFLPGEISSCARKGDGEEGGDCSHRSGLRSRSQPLSLMEFAGRRLNQQSALESALTSTGFAGHGLTCLAITS